MDPKQTPTRNQKKQPKWTLMFYFASDNPLAPGIVSQLKAIKNAGFHKKVNVVAQFDPQPVNTPTHIFDVNYVEKLRSEDDYHIGFTANDPYVRTLVGDKLWSTERGKDGELIRQRVKAELEKQGIRDYKPPKPSGPYNANGNGAENEPGPIRSLREFLRFCAEEYPADHYMLFILGHGIVVGNDLFLFDEHTEKDPALTLKDLRARLAEFKRICKGELELVSFHSCSMSSVEVAYELAGTARYMLASQGPAFVGSWPYRQILIRIFNDVVRQRTARHEIDETIKKIYAYCLYNSYDFQLAGYSFDTTLTNLEWVRAGRVKAALENLSKALCAGLSETQDELSGKDGNNGRVVPKANLARDLIILSHWEAQSYYEENFTDLGDFCFCLGRRCEGYMKLLTDRTPKSIDGIMKACDDMLEALEIRNSKQTRQLRDKTPPPLRRGFTGPAYQYSHGLSIYFPWSRPVDSNMWTTQYEKYKLTKATKGCWRDFLNEYFNKTMRNPQAVEKTQAGYHVREPDSYAGLLEDITGLVFNAEGALDSSPLKDTKVDPTGGDCVCPSIKNYPPTTIKAGTSEPTVPASENVLRKLRLFAEGDQNNGAQ